METIAIGERKVFTDVTLEVVEVDVCSCSGCWFQDQPNKCFTHPRHSIMGSCMGYFRTDGKDVIFKAVKETT